MWRHCDVSQMGVQNQREQHAYSYIVISIMTSVEMVIHTNFPSDA